MDREVLNQLYVQKQMSVCDISLSMGCSQGRINYWLNKHGISKRTISDAIYARHNPNGDPFCSRTPRTHEEAFLAGLGIGLYWGEGTKKSVSAVRLGNTDPHLVRAFILYLRRLHGIDAAKLRFAIQIFTDMDQEAEERYWQKFLGVCKSQFYKTINTRSGSIGTYRKKSEHGVLTVYFNNKKLRDVLVREIERMKELR